MRSVYSLRFIVYRGLRLYLIILTALTALTGFAQQAGETVNVYQKNGQTLSFPRSDIREISYSKEDLQGKTHDDVVTQRIVLADGDSKLLLADIDSVCFVVSNEGKNQKSVNLGLSVEWAECNIGASNPWESGLYFNWGETVGHTAEESFVNHWGNYKWSDGEGLTKYNFQSLYGPVDKKSKLDDDDDAAQVIWGNGWRLPTRKEIEELSSKCSWTLSSQNGVSGYKVTGPSGKSIFLPFTGTIVFGELELKGTLGSFWTSECDDEESVCAWEMWYSDIFEIYDPSTEERIYAQPIRPVRTVSK